MIYNSPFPISICLQAPYQSNSWYSFFHMKKKNEKTFHSEHKLIKLMFEWIVVHQALL